MGLFLSSSQKMNSHQLTPGELKHVGPNESYMGSVITVNNKQHIFLPHFQGATLFPETGPQ